MTSIIKATLADLHSVATLFDAYRVFYKQDTDILKATKFLEERMTKNQSEIFLAITDDKPSGFVQLYSSFSSVSMQPIFILNDLYVDASYRKKGIGTLLLNRTKEHCKFLGYKGLLIETATDNPAQKLYEALEWKKDTASFHYFWHCD